MESKSPPKTLFRAFATSCIIFLLGVSAALAAGSAKDRRGDSSPEARDRAGASGAGITVKTPAASPSPHAAPSPPAAPPRPLLAEFWFNFRHNLFKPLLLFFFLGFLVPILRVEFEFPYAIYQGLTIYLLLAIGWKGGEELARAESGSLGVIFGLMLVGFLTNLCIGMLAYLGLRLFCPRMRRVDQATVAGYYGSDSAGTFVTCLGILATGGIAYGAYMPVMLAVMEVPGCLVALYLVSRLRRQGMDSSGAMPGEPGHAAFVNAQAGAVAGTEHARQVEEEIEIALEKREHADPAVDPKPAGGPGSYAQLLHEVFLNPGLFLLLGGIVIGLVSGLQGEAVTREDDRFFIALFQGVLCLFLLEMGMTASRKLRDLRRGGPGLLMFALGAPACFATLGICVIHAYSALVHVPFELGSYVLFSVLCAAASYIALPAVQRLAIPEASPTLPLAASLGVTFTFNVTIGIPIYILIARALMQAIPV